MDKGQESGSPSPAAPPHEATPRGSRRWWPWVVLAALALLAGAVVFVVRWRGSPERPGQAPLDGELIVFVRPGGGGKESLRVEEKGALPVRAGGRMNLEVHFNQPAYAYLVWFDCRGRSVPLYPWNYDSLEVTEVGQPPPARRPANVVFSPILGTGWEFGKRGGLETVLLLARRTPLSEETRLGSLLGPLAPAKVRRRDEVAVLGLGGGADSVSTLLAFNRGPEEEARAADEPLRALLARLRDHFELIRAVRFAHEGE